MNGAKLVTPLTTVGLVFGKIVIPTVGPLAAKGPEGWTTKRANFAVGVVAVF